ncbi:SCN11A [Symbiodinium sp. CCMP2592]|nr:SCN11A [Symbiodinium sp. CCMP2592]
MGGNSPPSPAAPSPLRNAASSTAWCDATGQPPANDIPSWLREALHVARATMLEAVERQHDIILQEMARKLEESATRTYLPLPGQPAAPARSQSGDQTLYSARDYAEGHLPRTLSEANNRPQTSQNSDRAVKGTSSTKNSAFIAAIQKRGGRPSKLSEVLARPVWHPGRWVSSTQFDVFFCLLILLNTLVMGLELQYDGLQRGYELGYPSFNSPASELWPHAEAAFAALDVMFGVAYLIEIFVRIAGTKRKFFCDATNWFDTSLVVLWLADLFLSQHMPLDSGMVRTLRLARVLRLVRLMRTMQGFDALYIMTTAMYGSLVVLFWSFMLLLLVQTTIAFCLTQILGGFFHAADVPVSQKIEIFQYFGTASRAMFTMFELTLANWTIVGRSLQENVSEYFAIFNVAYKLVVGFAAVGIINAVFMQETFKVASSDDNVMMRQKERDLRLHTKKMKTLFEAADESGDGVIDLDEFRKIFELEEIRTWLSAQDLPVSNPDLLFRLLDDGDGGLTAEELVKGVDRLKGSAKGMDLEAFVMEHRAFAREVFSKLDMSERGRGIAADAASLPL